MKTARIKSLYGKNFKGIGERAINFDGSNAVISGANGAGKSTILNLYLYLLTGKFADGKTGEIGNLNGDSEANIIGEVTFDNGTTFRRETNGTSKFFVNGVPVKMAEYFGAVREMTNDTAAFLTSPQSFNRLHYTEQRRILMPLANITDAEVIASAPELEELAEKLQTLTPEQIDKQAKDKRKRLSGELAGIPFRIEELQKQIEGAPDKAELTDKLAKLQAEFDSKTKVLSEMQATADKNSKPDADLNDIRKSIFEATNNFNKTQSQFNTNEAKLNIQRANYKKMKYAMKGTCPTCGATVTNAKATELQATLDKIAAECKPISEKQKSLERDISAAQAKIDKLMEQEAKLAAAVDECANQSLLHKIVELTNGRDKIQNEINDANCKLHDAQKADEAAKRIEELRRRETEVNNQISELDKQIHLAGLFVRQKIKLTEDAINAQFKIVKFKMFDDFKTVDGVKECCCATIDGIPFGELSKGERLKASLDILRTLQKFYDVELPVFIDDAESYTSNSLIKLPNQTIKLKAVEGVKGLKIDVEQPYGQLEFDFARETA